MGIRYSQKLPFKKSRVVDLDPHDWRNEINWSCWTQIWILIRGIYEEGNEEKNLKSFIYRKSGTAKNCP
jgi:hypothetical protein